MEYTDDAAEFYKDGILIALAEKCNRLFKLVQEERRRDFGLLVSRKDNTATDLWHHRLGHLHLPAVLKRSNTEVVDGMPCQQANNSGNRYTACLMGKMTRTPFKPSTSRMNAALELIHSDLCGPMQSRSLGGCRYFMLFVDDYTKFTTVYFLKSKNEAANQFQHFKAAVENVFSDKDNQIKAIRTDGGGEYSSGEFQQKLKNSRIQWQVTVPYTPQEDGVAENSNRVLVGRANALIQHADAPKNYWAEALLTTVYLKNISLTKGTHGKDVTPYQLWHGSKPDIKHLRVWGCTAYAFVHLAKRQDKKWSPRAERKVFVGYTHTAKQYRLYNPSTKRLVKSLDVVFHEDTSFFKPGAQKITLPFTDNIEEPAISRSPSPISSDILPLPSPPPPTTGREIQRPLPAWVRKPSIISHGECSTASRRRKTPKLSFSGAS